MEPLKDGCVERCPGCSHRLMTLSASLLQKEEWLKSQLKAFTDTVEPIRSETESGRWGYRKKVLLTAQVSNNRWNFGMIRRDEFIAIPDCPIHAEPVRKLIRLLIAVLPPASRFPLAFLVQSDTLVTLVLKTREHPLMAWFTETVARELEQIGIQGFSIHLNPSAGRRMFMKGGWGFHWGEDHAFNEAGLMYGRTTFSQLIHNLHRQSLDEAETFLNPRENDCILDLYCGIGSSLVRWARHKALARGIETGGEAVECARHNVPGSIVLRGTCQQRLPQVQQWIDASLLPGKQKLVYANPPRTGIEPVVLEWMIEKMIPLKLAYLSCSAGTLKRDLIRLTSAGYRVERTLPFDFFPQTRHVECLALLERKPSG